MGLNIHKVEYNCDILHDPYGGCDQKNCFILVLSRSTDYWKLFHKTHDGELYAIESFTDNQISALKEMFIRPGKHSPDDGIHITNKELSEINKKIFL